MGEHQFNMAHPQIHTHSNMHVKEIQAHFMEMT